MEDFGIKKNGFVDPNAPGSNGRDKATAFEGLKDSFQDLISKAATNFDSSLANGASATAFLSQVKTTDYSPELRTRDHQVSRDTKSSGSDERRDEAPFETARADNSDLPRTERPDAVRQDNPASRSGEQEHHSRDTSESKGPSTDPTGHDNEHSETNTAAKEDAGTPDNNNEASQNQNQSDNPQSAENTNSGEQKSAGVAEVAGQTVVQASAGNLDVAAILQGTQVGKVQTGANETSAPKTGDNIVSAVAGSTKQATGQGTPAGQSHQLGQNTQTTQGAQASSDAIAKGVTTTQQQSAELAKAIGGANKTQVSVSVSSDAETLVSKPGASLAAGTVLTSTNAQGQSQGNAQGNSHQAAQGQNAAQTVAAAQAQASQQQAQAQQNANQNAQVQAGQQNIGDGKGGGAGLQTAQAASAGTSAGSSESVLTQLAATNSTGNAQQTQQTQQSQQAHANHGARASTSNQPIVDQISVKITKALQAGMDRISVQLRPAELGRVEVKMELGNDGRVLAVVTADSKDTMELLKRDSGDLQRALEDAGMQLDSNDLTFNLRGEERDQAELGPNAQGRNQSAGEDVLGEDDILDTAIIAEQNTDISKGRIDVKA